MGMKTPYICEIAPDTYAINEFGFAAMYLLVGRESALLIDTGCGYCDLRKLIGEITDKPYDVVITHGHFDHVGGMGCFDVVYLNKADQALALSLDRKTVSGYADTFGKAGGYEVFDYDPERIMAPEKVPKFLPLNDEQVFDLGDRVITTYAIPGHTAGGMVFLDDKNRIVFSGDCCNTNLLAPNCSVETTLRALEKFKGLSTRFDQNFNGHIGYMGKTNCLSQPKAVADDLIHICKSILNCEGTATPFAFLGYQLTKMCYGCAGLSYDPERLTEQEDENEQ